MKLLKFHKKREYLKAKINRLETLGKKENTRDMYTTRVESR